MVFVIVAALALILIEVALARDTATDGIVRAPRWPDHALALVISLIFGAAGQLTFNFVRSAMGF